MAALPSHVSWGPIARTISWGSSRQGFSQPAPTVDIQNAQLGVVLGCSLFDYIVRNIKRGGTIVALVTLREYTLLQTPLPSLGAPSTEDHEAGDAIPTPQQPSQGRLSCAASLRRSR